MAILNVRQLGEECLTKKCKPVKLITSRTVQLVEDMLDTMYESNGVGLAAPQVGVLKRIVVIDTTPEPEVIDGVEQPVKEQMYVMINPVILTEEGEQRGWEGCLSYSGMSGIVTRPNEVTVEYTNLDGERCTLYGTGLLARAISHEVDHLDGIMYTERAEKGSVITNEQLEKLLEEQEEGTDETDIHGNA